MGDIESPQFTDTSAGVVIFGAAKSKGKSVKKPRILFYKIFSLQFYQPWEQHLWQFCVFDVNYTDEKAIIAKRKEFIEWVTGSNGNRKKMFIYISLWGMRYDV